MNSKPPNPDSRNTGALMIRKELWGKLYHYSTRQPYGRILYSNCDQAPKCLGEYSTVANQEHHGRMVKRAGPFFQILIEDAVCWDATLSRKYS